MRVGSKVAQHRSAVRIVGWNTPAWGSARAGELAPSPAALLGLHRMLSKTLDQFTYDDDIVRKFTFATIGWALVATLVGLFIALELVLPGLSGGISFLSFGRLRPLHTNAAIFAFAGNAVFTAVYYSR
jgi:hypothetical protein